MATLEELADRLDLIEEDDEDPREVDVERATTLETSQTAIAEVCDDVKRMLLEKNTAYGDSALDPVRIFSKADPDEQINVRIDDKLSRLKRGHPFAEEDTIFDLVGYLVLKLVYRRRNQK